MATSLSYGAGMLTLYENYVQIDTLAFSGANGAAFRLTSDGHGGTDIMYQSSPYDAAAAHLAPGHDGLAVAERIIADMIGYARL